MDSQCIAAISTAAGTGGVAIIRLSGSGALEIAGKVFSPAGKREVKDFRPRYMYAGSIAAAGGITDFGLCVYFRAPHSFTGEDVGGGGGWGTRGGGGGGGGGSYG